MLPGANILSPVDKSGDRIGRTLQSLQSRAPDPLKVLRALDIIVTQLIPLVAGNLFVAELESFLQQFPPSRRQHHRAAIWRHTLYGDFENSLAALRALEKNKLHVPGNQLPEQGQVTSSLFSPLSPFYQR